MRERELDRRVDSKVYVGGKMTDLSTTDDFWGGDSSPFSGPFPLLTVLSGFCSNGPLLALGGLRLPPPRWTHHQGEVGLGGSAARSQGK